MLDGQAGIDKRAEFHFIQCKLNRSGNIALMLPLGYVPANIPAYPLYLHRLFLRPDIRIVRELAAATDSQSQVDLDGSVADYDYDNDRDTADYCPDLPLSVSTGPTTARICRSA